MFIQAVKSYAGVLIESQNKQIVIALAPPPIIKAKLQNVLEEPVVLSSVCTRLEDSLMQPNTNKLSMTVDAPNCN